MRKSEPLQQPHRFLERDRVDWKKGRERRSRDRWSGECRIWVVGPRQRSIGGSKNPQGGVEDFSWKGWAGEEDEDAGVGIKEGVKKDGRNQAVFRSINTCEGDTEKCERNQSRGVHVNGTKSESGKPLGLGNRHPMCQPGKKSSSKKNLLPDWGDEKGIGEKWEERLGIACFEEAGHGGLGFEGKTEKKKEAGA